MRRSRSLTFENGLQCENSVATAKVLFIFYSIDSKENDTGIIKKDYISDSKAGGALASTLDNTPYLDLAIEAER